jgi:hypothetical protein
MILIRTMRGDDASFISLINRAVERVVQEIKPNDVFVIRTDQWFDHKWLGFSGKILGAVEIRQERLTIPPFVPERIVSEEAFSFEKSSSSYDSFVAPPLHLRQSSRENLTRFIDRVSKEAIFVWFGGATQSTGGSIMVYSSMGDVQNSWYVSLRAKDTWQVYKTKGISKREFLHLIRERLPVHNK